MNEIINNIVTRCSVRSYTSEEIESDKLELIIKAGLYAPSAMNTQPWTLTVVRDKDKLEQLRAAVEKALDRSGYKRFYGADTLIIVTVPAGYKHAAADTACVLENMFLAAHSLGIGSVWINQLNDCHSDSAVRELLTRWGVPEGDICCGCGAFGYAAGEICSDRENKGRVNYVD